MKIEKVNEIKAPGDGILSVSFQPHPVDDQWDLERVAICGEKGVFIWLFDYNGNHKKLAFIESITSSIIKLCRWSLDGKYLAIVDMEQICVYYKENDKYSNITKNSDIIDDNGNNKIIGNNEILENWIIYTSFSCNDVNECTDICWLKGSKILVNGTISGNVIFYNIEEKCQSSNLFIRDIIESGLKKKNLSINNCEIGHVSGINSDIKSLFLACQMSSKRLFIFEITYNKENGKETLSKRNCVNLTFLLEEDRLIMNSPCILTFIRRPIFDPLTCLIGCPYGEVGTSYFSCLFPFRDISDNKPFGWNEFNRSKIEDINQDFDKIHLKNNISDIWNFHSENKNITNSKLEFPEAYRLRGHQRRVRIFQFSSVVFQEKDEFFSLCAQSSQDGSLSLWKIIYDLNSYSKVKSIECFLVLTNFMDEQASVTDISFNNMNNTILIGSDDNKLTLITFEFEEFSLIKPSSRLSLSNLNYNAWYFDHKPEKPSIETKDFSNKIQTNQYTKQVLLPAITANEIIEYQEKTQESIINNKGNKIRRIKPLNLTQIFNNEVDNLNSNINILSNVSNDVNDEHLKQSNKINDNMNKKIKKNENISENALDIKLINKVMNNEKITNNSINENNITEDNIKNNNEQNKNNFIENKNELSYDHFYLNSFLKEFIQNIKIPPRLVIDTEFEIDNKIYKITVLADNRRILDNKNKNRVISNEIICIKQELDDNCNLMENDSKEVLWYKQIENNNIITRMVRIKSIIFIFYSNINDKNNLFINTTIDILNFKTGTDIITKITIPYVFKLTICEFLNLILLITINGKLKLLQIPTIPNDNMSSFEINWLLDTDWSYLSNSRLEKVDLFSSKNELFNCFNDDNAIKPIIILYFDDGKVFTYSFDISNFIRIDDLEYYNSDFWSLVFPETTLQYSNANSKCKIIQDISIAISNESEECDKDVNCLKNQTEFICNRHDNNYFLREIQKNSRLISLKYQHKLNKEYKIHTLFDHILNSTIFNDDDNDDYSNKSSNIESTKLHIEHQLLASLTIYSKNEFKYWFKIYLKHTLETFNKELIKEIVVHCINLIRESIFDTKINKKRSKSPVWFNYAMLNSIEIDPINILLNNVIPSIEDFINFSRDSSKMFELSIFRPKDNIDINDFSQELLDIKEYIKSQIKVIQEEYDVNKFSKINQTQSIHLSQNSNTSSYSRFDILNSFL